MGIGSTLIVAAVVVVPGEVVEFERAADEWLVRVVSAETRAFDEFFPGIEGGRGCLSNWPATLELAHGTLIVSAFDDQNVPSCPIADEQSRNPVSDGRLVGPAPGRLIVDFDPEIYGFYSYYGSLASEAIMRMRLYRSGELVREFTGPLFTDGAVGHGFYSDTPVDRVEYETTEVGLVMLGAFGGLASDEPSLGSVMIPEYGYEVPLDFGIAFGLGACCLPTGDCDLVTEESCASQGGLWQGRETTCADFNGNGIADECERIGICRSDSNGDGVVDLIDLITLLQDWGPCPE